MNQSAKASPPNRTRFIDLMKALAMLYVAAYHISNLDYKFLAGSSVMSCLNYYLRCAFVCCVPLFLVANGYLLFRHDFDLNQHLRKTARYVILTLFWGVVTLALYDLMYGVEIGLGSFVNDLLTWRGGVIHLWYMGALVIIYLLFPVLKFVYDRDRKLILYVMAVTFLFAFGNEHINHIATFADAARGKAPDWIEQYNWFTMFNPVAKIPAFTLVYFCAGGFLDDILGWLRKFPRRRVNLLCAVGLAVFCGIHAVDFGLLWKAANNYICPIWYGYGTVTGIAITACILTLCTNYRGTWAPGARLLEWISRNTLGIYFLHIILFYLFLRRLMTFRPLYNLPGNLLCGALTVLACAGIVSAFKKIPGLKQLVK